MMKNVRGSRETNPNKNRANVNSRLHITTEVKPLGIGESVASVPNRVFAQGKRQIWANTSWAIRTAEVSTAVSAARRASLAAASLIREQADLELQRYTLFCSLRLELGDLIKSKGVNSVPPLLAFERWQFECKCAEELQFPLRKTKDPLFPQVPDYQEPQLLDDLRRIGLTGVDAADIAKKLMQRSCESAQTLSGLLDKATDASSPLDVFPVINRHNVDLKLGPDGRARFKVNHEHVVKLRALWTAGRPAAAASVAALPPGAAGAAASAALLQGDDSDARQFRQDLFRLLARYQVGLSMACWHLGVRSASSLGVLNSVAAAVLVPPARAIPGGPRPAPLSPCRGIPWLACVAHRHCPLRASALARFPRCRYPQQASGGGERRRRAAGGSGGNTRNRRRKQQQHTQLSSGGGGRRGSQQQQL
jgi:hypothetical protein